MGGYIWIIFISLLSVPQEVLEESKSWLNLNYARTWCTLEDMEVLSPHKVDHNFYSLLSIMETKPSLFKKQINNQSFIWLFFSQVFLSCDWNQMSLVRVAVQLCPKHSSVPKHQSCTDCSQQWAWQLCWLWYRFLLCLSPEAVQLDGSGVCLLDARAVYVQN